MKSRHFCTFRRACDRLSETSSGFALVIALSLMAFVLLLVLSITTLIQVETSSAQINLQALQNRENARLALTMAIAQLQRYVGHDQRITARAELLGDEQFHPRARFWTGVWDAKDMNEAPVWLVSGKNTDAKTATANTIQLVGRGTVGDDPSQFVYVPTIEMLRDNGTVSSRLGWWISDEGVKASVANCPLNKRPPPNFRIEEDALQLQSVSSHGLEAIFDTYDRFTSSSTKLTDRVSSIEQLITLNGFRESVPDTSQEALFHTLTLNSYGVLASTTDNGLMQDLSIFPALLGTGLQNYLQLGETHANTLAAQANTLAKKLLFTDIVGLESMETIQDGDIATPIIPVLSNFMIAFTIRTKNEHPEKNNENFLIRARFFCEFWNPFTHTLSMNDKNGKPITLELEITGFPEVTVKSDSNSREPINLQTIMKDPNNENDAVVIQLLNGANEPWFPGRSKNWVGLETINELPHSPYKSIDTETKEWPENDRALGGIDGIDTGVRGFSGDIRHENTRSHALKINVYQATETSRELVVQLDKFRYEPVSTINPNNAGGYFANNHKLMTFGYHIMLKEPYHSNFDGEFPRGIWLKDNDPRNPKPLLLNDWHLDSNTNAGIGSPYIAAFNGKSPLLIPEPHEINQLGSHTLSFRDHERLLDRSKDTKVSLHELWQDAPLFELPRRRVLSLASLQHIYIHNERPFQVGNSWGNQGEHNTSSWFDRYYFSGFSRSDDMNDFNSRIGPNNPYLQFISADSFITRFDSWRKDHPPDDKIAARNPAQYLMVANRFNINSTSVNAWKAVLSSLRIDGFDHLHWPDEDTSDLDTLSLLSISRKEGNFTRFSHSLEETCQATIPPARLNAAPSAFYRLGARRFESEDFTDFAEEIVRLLQKRGKPFESMEAFLSESSPDQGSLLEQAIRNVLTNPSSAVKNIRSL